MVLAVAPGAQGSEAFYETQLVKPGCNRSVILRRRREDGAVMHNHQYSRSSPLAGVERRPLRGRRTSRSERSFNEQAPSGLDLASWRTASSRRGSVAGLADGGGRPLPARERGPRRRGSRLADGGGRPHAGLAGVSAANVLTRARIEERSHLRLAPPGPEKPVSAADDREPLRFGGDGRVGPLCHPAPRCGQLEGRLSLRSLERRCRGALAHRRTAQSSAALRHGHRAGARAL